MSLESLNEKFDIWKYNIPLPKDMIMKIYSLRDIDPVGAKKSNYGGWHSISFFPNSEETLWLDNHFLSEEFTISEKKYRISNFWFNINSKGNYNDWHDHSFRPIVGVLYISVPKNSGDIEFRKDRETFSYTPKNGDFLIFPGTLEHRVLENKTSEDRISLAVNFSA